jgi:putative membrane protein
MFSAHMLSMSIAYLIAPPLILLGLPAWLLKPMIEHKWIAPVFRFLIHPLIAVLAFNMLFSFYHFPAVHDYVMTHYAVHTIYYVLLLISAFMMWWPILSPLPETVRLSELRKIAYVFANGVILTPVCALVIFAGYPMYATFNDPQLWVQAMGYCMPQGTDNALLATFAGPSQFAIFPPIEDQQLGGVIMKVIQELVYGAVIAYIFFRWYARERGEDEQSNPKPQELNLIFK